MALQDIDSLDAAVDVEGHSGCREAFFGGTEIVKETCQSPSGWIEARELLWELLLGNCHSCSG
jgi:hypothetical protein